MKQPLYALLIAPSETDRRAIARGEKTVTVREGHRDYKPGSAALFCHLVPWAVMVDIVEVRHTTLDLVTLEEVQADGFKYLPELKVDLQQYYPSIRWDSPVTVIRWANVRGALAEASR